MSENTRKLYAARPINTYNRSADVGDAYLSFLEYRFPDFQLVDPNSPEIVAHVKKLKSECSIDPATGQSSEEYYNKFGSAKVMDYFTNEVVGPCVMGVGLLIPVYEDGKVVYRVPAGIAGELLKFWELERPIGIVVAERFADGTMLFSADRIMSVSKDEMRSTQKETCHLFVTDSGLTYSQLSVDETRARIYTRKSDGGWDRNKLRPYFLEDETPGK